MIALATYLTLTAVSAWVGYIVHDWRRETRADATRNRMEGVQS